MKIVILSGTSCVGKTPLLNAMQRVYPNFRFSRPLLYTSRSPRPGEKDGVDYHFRTEPEIQGLNTDRFAIAKTRQLWQAVDVRELMRMSGDSGIVIFDIYPTLARKLISHQEIAHTDKEIKWLKIFIQPATLQDIDNVRRAMGDVSRAEALTAIQVTKLVKRARNQGVKLTGAVMQDISIRAQKAWEEVLCGQEYDHVLTNHDGEESPHWNETPPLGEAGETLQHFYKIVSG